MLICNEWFKQILLLDQILWKSSKYSDTDFQMAYECHVDTAKEYDSTSKIRQQIVSCNMINEMSNTFKINDHKCA